MSHEMCSEHPDTLVVKVTPGAALEGLNPVNQPRAIVRFATCENECCHDVVISIFGGTLAVGLKLDPEDAEAMADHMKKAAQEAREARQLAQGGVN